MKICKENKQTKEKDEGNWEHGYGHCVLVEEGSLMLITEVVKAIASKEAELLTQSDASTQIGPTTIKTATQTKDNPTALVASPSPPLPAATSPIMMAAQPASMMQTSLTTTTTAAPPASTQLPTHQKQCYTLPNQSTAPLPSPEPLFPHSSPQHHTVMPPPTTVDILAAPNSETTTWVLSSIQTMATNLCTNCQALNDVVSQPAALRTKVRNDEQVYLSKRVVYSMEWLSPYRTLNKGPAAPRSPQLVSLPPVLQLEQLNATATSPSTMAMLPATTTTKTTTWVTSSTQMTVATSEIHPQAIKDTQNPSTAQGTPLCKDVQVHSPECVIHSTNQLSQPPLHQQ